MISQFTRILYIYNYLARIQRYNELLIRQDSYTILNVVNPTFDKN